MVSKDSDLELANGIHINEKPSASNSNKSRVLTRLLQNLRTFEFQYK